MMKWPEFVDSIKAEPDYICGEEVERRLIEVKGKRYVLVTVEYFLKIPGGCKAVKKRVLYDFETEDIIGIM